MDREAWRAAKSWTWLSNFYFFSLSPTKGLSFIFKKTLSVIDFLFYCFSNLFYFCPNLYYYLPSANFGLVWVKSFSRVRLFVTPWTVAHQAPQSMEFSRQEYWSELPFPPPGDLANPGIKPGSPALQADALPSEPPGKPTLGLVCSFSGVLSHKVRLFIWDLSSFRM